MINRAINTISLTENNWEIRMKAFFIINVGVTFALIKFLRSHCIALFSHTPPKMTNIVSKYTFLLSYWNQHLKKMFTADLARGNHLCIWVKLLRMEENRHKGHIYFYFAVKIHQFWNLKFWFNSLPLFLLQGCQF